MKIKAYTHNGLRFYCTPAGDYPSVTTVLGATLPQDWLQAWKARVGAEQANQIRREAAQIGSYLHYLLECYLKNTQARAPETKEEKQAKNLSKIIMHYLDKTIDEILFVEEIAWSDTLRVAGRFDLLCKIKGKNVLIDFKNSRTIKNKNQIDAYRLQLAFYDRMIKETLNIDVDEQKILMISRDGLLQIFNFYMSDDTMREISDLRQKFFEQYEV